MSFRRVAAKVERARGIKSGRSLTSLAALPVICSSISRLQRGEIAKDRTAGGGLTEGGGTVHLTSLSASSAHKRLNDFSFAKHH